MMHLLAALWTALSVSISGMDGAVAHAPQVQEVLQAARVQARGRLHGPRPGLPERSDDSDETVRRGGERWLGGRLAEPASRNEPPSRADSGKTG